MKDKIIFILIFKSLNSFPLTLLFFTFNEKLLKYFPRVI